MKDKKYIVIIVIAFLAIGSIFLEHKKKEISFESRLEAIQSEYNARMHDIKQEKRTLEKQLSAEKEKYQELLEFKEKHQELLEYNAFRSSVVDVRISPSETAGLKKNEPAPANIVEEANPSDDLPFQPQEISSRERIENRWQSLTNELSPDKKDAFTRLISDYEEKIKQLNRDGLNHDEFAAKDDEYTKQLKEDLSEVLDDGYLEDLKNDPEYQAQNTLRFLKECGFLFDEQKETELLSLWVEVNNDIDLTPAGYSQEVFENNPNEPQRRTLQPEMNGVHTQYLKRAGLILSAEEIDSLRKSLTHYQEMLKRYKQPSS